MVSIHLIRVPDALPYSFALLHRISDRPLQQRYGLVWRAHHHGPPRVVITQDRIKIGRQVVGALVIYACQWTCAQVCIFV